MSTVLAHAFTVSTPHWKRRAYASLELMILLSASTLLSILLSVVYVLTGLYVLLE